MSNMQPLTDKQEMFCYEYLVDFNATQAAIRAGYRESSASVSGSRNLSNTAVSKRLQELMEERKARVAASSDYVLQRLIEIDCLDVADILDDEGNVISIKDWSEDWRKSIAAIDISEAKTASALVKKIRLPDKLKNLELIGKHINVSAFRERMELSGSDGRELVINVNSTSAKNELVKLQTSLSKE